MTETIRRRAHRGVYGEVSEIKNNAKIKRYLINLDNVRANLFPEMGEDEFYGTVERQIKK